MSWLSAGRWAPLLLLSALGCAERGSTTPPPTSDSRKAVAATLRTAPLNGKQLTTTSANIYLQNLDARIDSLRAQLHRQPEAETVAATLSSARHRRGLYRGDLGEIQRAISLSSSWIQKAPTNASFYLLRAQQRLSLHRIDGADADLRKALTLGASPGSVASLRRDIDWAQGRHEAASAAIRLAARKRPSMRSLARLALLEHALGDYHAADVAFQHAEDLVTDTNPLSLAWLNVQRGHHKLSIGAYAEAERFLREATRRAPQYVMAQEHLAESLMLQGRDAEAIALYEKIIARSSDPEFMGVLAGLYREAGRQTEADALRDRAKKRFDALLTRYPEAMSFHAANFFLEEGGDAARAVTLLRENARLRPNGQSHAALAKAMLAADDLAGAQKALDRAFASPLVSSDLFETAARAHQRAGATAKAAEMLARAKKLNPHAEI